MIPPLCTSSFNALETISIDCLHEIVMKLKLTTSVMDIIPACLLIQFFNITGPCILSIINKQLSVGFVPEYLKHATVKLLLKKSNLAVTVLLNFRPITNLPFIFINP